MSVVRTRLMFFGAAAAASSYYGYSHYFGTQAMSSRALDNKATRDILAVHDGVWNTLRLSTKTQQELQQTVESLYKSLREFESGSNDHNVMHELGASKQQQSAPLSYKEYMNAHAARFDKLGLSNSTKNELIAATRWVWKVLHDEFETYSDDDVKRAQIIKNMMQQMGGPPPCCDDALFDKAQ